MDNAALKKGLDIQKVQFKQLRAHRSTEDMHRTLEVARGERD
jgi:hypothetical protein